MENGLIFAICIAVLAVQGIIAVIFANIAESKGYNKTNYLLAGIFFGIIVYVMIAALRDLTLDMKIDTLQKQFVDAKTELAGAEDDAVLPEL